MSAICALDLGTSTGFMIGDERANASGTVDLKAASRYEGGGMRYLRFRHWLEETWRIRPFELVAFEEVRRHLGTDAAHVYGGLLAVLTSWCEDPLARGGSKEFPAAPVPYEGVPVGTIKRFATSKGNASKDLMIAAVREWGFSPATDDEADAIALWHFWQAKGGR